MIKATKEKLIISVEDILATLTEQEWEDIYKEAKRMANDKPLKAKKKQNKLKGGGVV
jgi:Mg/Co/Ni transporter MgtE